MRLTSLKLFLYRLLKIRQSDENKLIIFMLAYFFLSMATGFLANILDSIFLGDESGASALSYVDIQTSDLVPIILMVSAILLIIISLIYSYYTDRFDKRVSLILVLLITSGITFLFWLLIYFFQRENMVLFSALYVFRLVITTFLVIQFWEMCNSYFDLREGRRLYPIILASGVIGYSMASFILVGTTYLFGTGNDLFMIIASALLSAFFLYRAGDFSSLIPRERKKGILDEVKSVIRIVKNNSFVGVFNISTLIFGVAAGLILYTYNDIVNSLQIGTQSLTVYIGVWRGSANLLVALIDSLIPAIEAGLIVQIMSHTQMGRGFILTLLVKIAGFFLLIMLFMFSMVATADFSRQILQALVTPSAVVAFSVLPRHVRGKIMNINNGMISQIGILLSGVLLQLLAGVRPLFILIAIMVLMGIRIVLNIVINRGYLKTLSKNIQSADLATIFHNIKSILHDNDLFDELMSRYDRQDTSIKVFILKSIKPHISELESDYVPDKLKEKLINEDEEQIKAVLIEIFYELKRYDITDLIWQYTESNDKELAKNAILYQCNYGSEERRKQLKDKLFRYIHSGDADEYSFGLSIIEQNSDDESKAFLPVIRERLVKGSDEIKNRSILTLASLGDTYSIGLISELLNDKLMLDNALRALIMTGEKSLNNIIAIIERTKAEDVERTRRLIGAIGEIKSMKTFFFLRSEFKTQANALLKRIGDNNNEYMEFKEFFLIESIVESIIRLGLDSLVSIKELSLKVVEAILQRAFIFLSISSQARYHIPNDNIALLFRKMCSEGITHSGYISAKILSLTNTHEHRTEAMLDSIVRFSSGNRLIRAQAFETFENYARSKYSHSVITLLDGSISEEDALNTLKKKLKKIKVRFVDIIRYWSGLDPSLSQEIRYKKLLADKILQMPRQIGTFGDDSSGVVDE